MMARIGLILGATYLVACSRTPPSLPAQMAAPTAYHSPAKQITPSPLPTIRLPPTVSSPPTATSTETLWPTLILPTLTPYPDDERFSIGNSVEGSPIWAWQFGDGPRLIVLVGGIHGGYEANTVVLSELLVDHFRRYPDEVLPGIRLVIIPVANPDGLLRGNRLEGRFNARGVDLNRNWGCDWSQTAYLRDIPVNPGPRPFSEPETLALRFYFVAEQPDVVLFYHSSAGGVFLGSCGDHPGARWLGKLLEESTGYPYGHFGYYEVTGDASNWLAERGIPAAIIELLSDTEPEFDRNLRGVMALQCYFMLQDRPDPTAVEALCQN